MKVHHVGVEFRLDFLPRLAEALGDHCLYLGLGVLEELVAALDERLKRRGEVEDRQAQLRRVPAAVGVELPCLVEELAESLDAARIAVRLVRQNALDRAVQLATRLADAMLIGQQHPPRVIHVLRVRALCQPVGKRPSAVIHDDGLFAGEHLPERPGGCRRVTLLPREAGQTEEGLTQRPQSTRRRERLERGREG